MNMHCFEWLSILGWLFFLVHRQEAPTITEISTSTSTHVSKTTTSATIKKQDQQVVDTTNKKTTITSYLMRGIINIFLVIILSTFVIDATPFNQFADFIPFDDTTIGSLLVAMEEYRTDVLLPNYYVPYIYPIGLYQGVWDLFTGTNDHNYRVESVITYHNGTEISHWSPDWGLMTWYEKKRYQRPMTYYENFIDAACRDCYATYYAQQYGPNVASVRLLSHCEYPLLSPPGNIFDMEYFFRPAKEEMIPREPEELFILNYCDDMDDRCEEYTKRGYCNSDDDDILFIAVRYCKYSCKMCNYDANALIVGSRVSLYYVNERRYYDASVLKVQVLHHIKRYLLQYDGFETPEWTSAINLQRQGFVILNETSTDSEVVNELFHKDASNADSGTVETQTSSSTILEDEDESDHEENDSDEMDRSDEENEDEATAETGHDENDPDEFDSIDEENNDEETEERFNDEL
jgi:hypothetical protein